MRLAEDADAALGAISGARAAARERVWGWAGAPIQDGRVVIDLDATLVTAHSEKEDATRTWKKTFGLHPLLGFVDHGSGGGGEPVAELLRPGNAGSNTAADHVTVLDAALAQLPAHLRAADAAGRRPVLVRTDAAGATHTFAAHLAQLGLEFSLGANLGYFGTHTALDSAIRSGVESRLPGTQTPRRRARSTDPTPRGRWGGRAHRAGRSVRLATGHPPDPA
jgi:hypothetical protein